MKSVSLKLDGTSCERCFLAMRNALQDFEDVQVTLVHSCSAQLHFDPTRRRIDEILDVIGVEGFAPSNRKVPSGLPS
jgi:copper chaperone CopZ